MSGFTEDLVLEEEGFDPEGGSRVSVTEVTPVIPPAESMVLGGGGAGGRHGLHADAGLGHVT